MNGIFEPGTPVTVLSNGGRVRAEVVSYDPRDGSYVVRMKSGTNWTVQGMWVLARKAR